ncbi:CmcJ/NvfI family oxidoreductase [Roseibium aggregatum]|uniref:CmcJ/NvfI family oxidoreductase n=1 Tax=Roseibium aggregatum TaxID=187304 RepID=UPI0025AB626E|nr:CmcJ/NvfI family oxidoreductase [Roseibium aggregatum]WJS05688.1 CmcJ/NvfI family oxidoreductase [Roseibium aggregatum]
MPSIGTVNYHVRKPYRQSFKIDAGGIPGKIVSSDLIAKEIRLNDLRAGEASVSFSEDGVGFLSAPTKVKSFDSPSDWRSNYTLEIERVLTAELGVRAVVVFDHTIRFDDPNSGRKPARNVHSDYSPAGAEKRLFDILGEEQAQAWSRDHFAFVNVWRPIDNPINSAPLAFVRPSSVSEDDWIALDLIYPDRRGQIMGLVGNDNHEWIYASRMRPDEVVYFNIFDNQGLPAVGHSAVDLIEDPFVSTVRKSEETRTVVRF